MSNPVVVEVTRGPLVESRHCGAVAVSDSAGRLLLALGDVDRPVYPRSAIKALQALTLIETRAARRFGFTDAELALACSSHNGEALQVKAARAMLAKAGLDESFLECGPQPPRREADHAALRVSGQVPGRIHNNCSGKHAGMLAAAVALGIDPHGYSRHDHPVQIRVCRAVEEMTGAALSEDACGTDGCSIPTWAAPLSALAQGFARFATGEGVPGERAAACARLRAACAAHPFMVAGTGRFCTDVMAAAGPAAFVKTGAEGVFCAAFPERGLGVALKIDDGASRASEALMAEIVRALVPLDPEAAGVIEHRARPKLANWAGQEIGEIRVAADVAERLAAL